MWSTGGEHVSDFTWHVTLLSDVSGEKAALRKSHDVELSLEVLVSGDLLAGFLSDGLEVVEDLTDKWEANFDAVNWGTSCSSNLLIKLKISWVDASISESMEHSSWCTLTGGISRSNIFNRVITLVLDGPKWGIMVLLIPHISFLGIFDQGALFVHVFW
jgi:hypothetical protein